MNVRRACNAALLAYFSWFLWLQPALASSEKEKYLTEMLSRDPNSEQLRYEYADYLYHEEKFDLALAQVDYVLRINPDNAKARRLKGYIEEVRALPEPKARKKKMMDYAVAEMREAANDLKKLSEDLQGMFAPGAVDKHQAQKAERQKALDRKYGISQSSESCDSFEKATLDFELTAIKYRSRGMHEEAIKTYRNGLKKKDTPKLRLGMVGVLFSDGRYADAAEEVAQARSRYPRDVRFRLYQEGLEEVDSIVSSEGKKAVQAATSQKVEDAQDILRDACKKARN